MELVLLAVAFLIGFGSGWRGREIHAIYHAKKLMSSIQPVNETTPNMSVLIEKHGETFYVFEAETNKFLTQANTRTELEQNLVDKFPGKKFSVSKENLKEVGFFE